MPEIKLKTPAIFTRNYYYHNQHGSLFFENTNLLYIVIITRLSSYYNIQNEYYLILSGPSGNSPPISVLRRGGKDIFLLNINNDFGKYTTITGTTAITHGATGDSCLLHGDRTRCTPRSSKSNEDRSRRTRARAPPRSRQCILFSNFRQLYYSD